MDTLRVDISYRPLRIGWAVRAGDFDAFRQAVRFSHALWGGRFNPILVVDREEEANRLVDIFRVDAIIPIGESDEVKSFSAKYPHIIDPMHDKIFMKGMEGYHPYSQVLDIHNALAHFREKPEWNRIRNEGFKIFTWDKTDPLADVLMIQLGEYPSKEGVGTDYRALLLAASNGTVSDLNLNFPIPTETIAHPTISQLSRFGLSRHYVLDSGRECPGFFVGSANNFDDLVCHWNLRAYDIPLWFVDPSHLNRFSDLIPEWERKMRERVANYRQEWDRHVAFWTRLEDLDEASKPFGGLNLLPCRITAETWNRATMSAPVMHFGQSSVLGVVGREAEIPKVSFALPEKPFCADSWFHSQHLIASVSFIGGLYGDERYTLKAPYIPELNEFYARNMHFLYDKLRVEPESVGIIIDVTDHNTSLRALPVASLVEKIFGMAGYETKLSSAGLISRQLASRLGGIQGARVFKIPGVRRLIKTHGPNKSFTKSSAVQIIGEKDPEHPSSKFSDHEDLFIAPRARGEKLSPQTVFGHLVEKALFRIGAELICPACRLNSWMPLDSLKHQVVCDLCGHEYNASRQLADSNQWHYRRTGILGIEKNAQGAIPVLLTLQQLDTSFHSGFSDNLYTPSLDLAPKASKEGIACETDFVWVISRSYPKKTVVILAECKDQGPISAQDVSNLKKVADAFPRTRFETFVVLSKIAPFTAEEIKEAKSLNDDNRLRAILLTSRELEPYFIFERTKAETGVDSHGGTPEQMAGVTAKLYFQ